MKMGEALFMDNPRERLCHQDGSWIDLAHCDNGTVIYDGAGNKHTLIQMVRQLGSKGEEIVFVGRGGWHRELRDLAGFSTETLTLGRYKHEELH